VPEREVCVTLVWKIKSRAEPTPNTHSERCQHGPKNKLDGVSRQSAWSNDSTYSIVYVRNGVEESKDRKGARKDGTNFLAFPTKRSGLSRWQKTQFGHLLFFENGIRDGFAAGTIGQDRSEHVRNSLYSDRCLSILGASKHTHVIFLGCLLQQSQSPGTR
jgi:hypothetical protein